MTKKNDSIIGVTCKDLHTTYFDMKKVCKEEIVFRANEQGSDGIEHFFYFPCEKCDEKTKVKINCEDYK